MLKRLLIMVALIVPCFASVAHAASDNLDSWNISQLIEASGFETVTEEHSLIIKNSDNGLHGSYATTPTRCGICHGSNNKGAGDLLKLSTTRDGACDWCHGAGSASARYIAMDNNDEGTLEYDTGHSRGFGMSTGKWKAPNDTYPAFTPGFWWGGLSCFDCHAAHANPARTLGHTAMGDPIYGVLDPGFNAIQTSVQPGKPSVFKAGRWFLKKNPDREFLEELGVEIEDHQGDDDSDFIRFPVNKVAINWDEPLTENPLGLTHSSVPCERVISVNELCVDCHDGNAGFHDEATLVYSEELALRGKTGIDSYTEASSHDSQPGTCSGQAVFNPEDGNNDGPSCRSCHRGAGDCELCHNDGSSAAIKWPREAYAMDPEIAKLKADASSDDLEIDNGSLVLNNYRQQHHVYWDPDLMSAEITCSPDCVNVGLSWPHRTLAWKMLKNDLFGIDLDGREVGPGERREVLARQLSLDLEPAHDLDSVCLDCHNPTAWRPGAKEAFIRGLP